MCPVVLKAGHQARKVGLNAPGGVDSRTPGTEGVGGDVGENGGENGEMDVA
jgi:hypothetical protein